MSIIGKIGLIMLILLAVAIADLPAYAELTVRLKIPTDYRDGSNLPKDCIQGFRYFCGPDKAHMPTEFWLPFDPTSTEDPKLTIPWSGGYCHVKAVIFERCNKCTGYSCLESEFSNIKGKPAPPTKATFSKE
jgi:hypothetical protein